MRFSEIRRQLPACSVKVLSQTLKDLETCNLVIRKQYSTIPVKVTYTFNTEHQSLAQLLPLLHHAFMIYMFKNPELYSGPSNRSR